MESLCLLVLVSLLFSNVEAQGNGAVRFYRLGRTSHLFNSGILQLYYVDLWGNICFVTEKWGTTEADVACRQMGWSGASSTSPSINAGGSFGIDELPLALGNVDCANNSFLVLLQCSYSTNNQPSCNDYTDVTISCYTTRLWDSLGYQGLLRIVGGSYVTEGRVEVYCNNWWGTICDDGLSNIEADTMCRQLGYSESIRYDHLILPGEPDQPIWLDDVLCGLEPKDCLSRCQLCPSNSSSRHNCVHGEDFTISCRFAADNRIGSNLETCSGFGILNDKEGPSKNLIIGIAVGGAALLIILAVPVIICFCVGCMKHAEPNKEGNANNSETVQEKAPTPIMAAMSPEVIQMDNSPRMYRKVEPKVENQYVTYPHIQQHNTAGYSNAHHRHVQPSAYSPYYQNEETDNGVLSVNDERQFVTTPPAYLGNPAPQYL